MGRAVPIPMPLKGLNTLMPDLPIEAGYARELTNYSIINGRLRMRPAVRGYATIDLGTLTWLPIWYSIGSSKPNSYWIFDDGKVVRMSDATVMTTLSTTGISTSKRPTRVKHISLDFVIGVGAPRLVDYPFTSWTFTTSAVTDTDITSACSHKGRLYVCNGTVIEYSNVGQITGAMYDSFDVSEFMQGQTVSRMFSFSSGTGNISQNVFVIFGDGGKVLVYAGDYPASSTWNLVGDYDMSAPLNAVSFAEVDGDIWISCSEYAYELSALIQSGVSQAVNNSPTKAIENLWQAQPIQGATTQPKPETVYIPKLDAILCNFGYFNPSLQMGQYNNYLIPFTYLGAPGALVYFRQYQAWALWLNYRCDSPMRYVAVNDTYYLYGTRYENDDVQELTRYDLTTNYANDQKLAAYPSTTTTDYPICTSWKTPYLNAFNGRVQKVTGVRPFFQSTENGYIFKIRSIFDYSDYTMPYGFYSQPGAEPAVSYVYPDLVVTPGNYSDVSVDVPTQASDNYAPFVGLTGQGGGVSLQISQQLKDESADAQTNEIYSATLYVEDGGDMI